MERRVRFGNWRDPRVECRKLPDSHFSYCYFAPRPHQKKRRSQIKPSNSCDWTVRPRLCCHSQCGTSNCPVNMLVTVLFLRSLRAGAGLGRKNSQAVSDHRCFSPFLTTYVPHAMPLRCHATRGLASPGESADEPPGPFASSGATSYMNPTRSL